jgi:hypothetical protein
MCKDWSKVPDFMTNTSPRLLFPSSFVQFFYLGLNLFSGAYWRGNRKFIYSRNLIKLHNQNRKMCFCKNYGGAQPFTFSYKYEKIKLRNKILGLYYYFPYLIGLNMYKINRLPQKFWLLLHTKLHIIQV